MRLKDGDKRRIIALTLIIVGLLLANYPMVQTTWNNWETARATARVIEQAATEQQNASALELAEAYNAKLDSFPVLDPWIDRVAKLDNDDWVEYVKQLSFDERGLMGRLSIETVNIDVPIYHGTHDETLERGAGHLFGSSLPVGGPHQHSIITAHSGLATASMFDSLRSVSVGDLIRLDFPGFIRVYRVSGARVIKPEDVSTLVPRAHEDLLTLITCTPYGINTHRLLIEAKRDQAAEAELSAAGKSPSLDLMGHIPVWVKWGFGIEFAVAGIIGFTIFMRRLRRTHVENKGLHVSRDNGRITGA
ncbi:class C sortase [Schaalia sp. lx-100]|uniref:class C sortase n=1 Tax=Schaalia sp. lx-100 TaxID=2899081 RepID=UPI001E286E22|nr:class C sortase [Schaalia sp. lx-100]MCD4557539.1 class C sortase [Schaalia sp. lx-100]